MRKKFHTGTESIKDAAKPGHSVTAAGKKNVSGKSMKVMARTLFAILPKLLAYHYQEDIHSGG